MTEAGTSAPRQAGVTPGRAALVLHAAIVITTLGMMLVVAGVVTTGLFLPGVLLIGFGLLVFAVAAVLSALAPAAAPATASASSAAGAG
jgi:hypothetical protein